MDSKIKGALALVGIGITVGAVLVWLLITYLGAKPKQVTIGPLEFEIPTPTTIAENSHTPSPTQTRPIGKPTSTPMTIDSDNRILFDESRDGLTLDPEKAEALVPEHPGYVYAGDLAREIRKIYDMDSLAEGPITAEVLANYRVLMLNSSWDWYSSQEIETIDNFIQSGGGLLVLGGSNSQNQLLEPIGIRFVGAPIEQVGTEGDFNVNVTISDPLLNGISHIEMHASSVIEVDDSPNVILWTGSNTWLDSDLDGVKDDREMQGPFPVVARVHYGRGRVVVFANNPIWAFGFSNNYLLVLSALDWLMIK